MLVDRADVGVGREDANATRKPAQIPKLNFQVMRRTMATQAQAMGSVKDIQAHLRHAKADTTANEYMQELPESVKKMVGSVYTMLTKGGESKQASGDLLPKATNLSEPLAVSIWKKW